MRLSTNIFNGSTGERPSRYTRHRRTQAETTNHSEATSTNIQEVEEEEKNDSTTHSMRRNLDANTEPTTLIHPRRRSMVARNTSASHDESQSMDAQGDLMRSIPNEFAVFMPLIPEEELDGDQRFSSHATLSSTFSWDSSILDESSSTVNAEHYPSTNTHEEAIEEGDGYMFIPFSNENSFLNPLFSTDTSSSSSAAYPHIYSIFESLFQTQIDRMIMDEITTESLSNYADELLRRNENVHLSSECGGVHKFSEGEARNSKCFVCMEDFRENEDVQCIPCAHVFHKECIENAVKFSTKCPLCRQEIPVDVSATTTTTT